MLHLRLVLCAIIFALPAKVLARELNQSAIGAAAAYSAARTGSSLLVIQRGKKLFSSGATSGHRIFSGTKGFWMLAALAADQEGIIDLDDRVADTIQEWGGDSRKSRVTVRELLNFTSGLEPVFALHNNNFADRNRAAISAPIVADPGTRFIYGPAALQVFEEYFKLKLAQRSDTPTRYLERKVLRPLGLGSQRYLNDRAGNPLLATGFIMAPWQWAKEGQLILSGGKPVLSSGALAQCFRGSGPNPSFGIGFWNNRLAPGGREVDVEKELDQKWFQQDWRGACLCRAAPPDLVAAIGSGGQRLYVVPSVDLVVIRYGNFGRFSDAAFLQLLFSGS